MTRNEINVILAAILTTALETEPGPFPESMAYLAMGSNLDKWESIRGLLVAGGLVTVAGNVIALTDKGREIARKCQAVAA